MDSSERPAFLEGLNLDAGPHRPGALSSSLERGDLDELQRGLRASARRMLRQNTRFDPATGKPFLVPAEKTYGAQSWLWDLVFGAHVATDLAHHAGSAKSQAAWTLLSDGCLDRTLGSQVQQGQERGLVPHMVFEGGVDAELWGAPTCSFISQPPVFATAVHELTSGNTRARLWPAVTAGLEWWLTRRLSAEGLVSIRHPWESGEDAARYHDSQMIESMAVAGALQHGLPLSSLAPHLSFSLDAALAQGDLLRLQTNNPSKKDSLLKAARFVLLAALRSVGGAEREVSAAGAPIYDVRAPSMSAHLVVDLRHASAMAEQLGDTARAERYRDDAAKLTEAMVAHLMTGDGWPRARGHRVAPPLLEAAQTLLAPVQGGEVSRRLQGLAAEVSADGVIACRTGTAAVVLGALPPGHDAALPLLDALADDSLKPRFGLPTLARDEDGYVQDDYWRGSTWVNIDWLTTQGLLAHAIGWRMRDPAKSQSFAKTAEELATASLRSVCGGYYEHYGADGIEGEPFPCGPVDFTWSGLAVLMVDQLRAARALLDS